MKQNDLLLVLFGTLLGLFSLAGCTPASAPAQAITQKTAFFRPSTPQSVVPSSAPTNASPQNNQPAPAVQCKNQLTYLKDLTIPDGSVVAPDSTLDKRWEVQNTGDCNWNADYHIRLIAGPDLNAQKEQALYPARAGSHAVIRFVFKAPLQPGSYRSAWQAFDPNGEPFGDAFFIDIKVQ
jgi:hypothetical protein